MKKTGMFLAVVLVSLSLFSAPSLAKNWEYKAINLTEGIETQLLAMNVERLREIFGEQRDLDEITSTEIFFTLLEKRLNSMGDQRWELVIVGPQMAMAIFKREKR